MLRDPSGNRRFGLTFEEITAENLKNPQSKILDPPESLAKNISPLIAAASNPKFRKKSLSHLRKFAPSSLATTIFQSKDPAVQEQLKKIRNLKHQQFQTVREVVQKTRNLNKLLETQQLKNQIYADFFNNFDPQELNTGVTNVRNLQALKQDPFNMTLTADSKGLMDPSEEHGEKPQILTPAVAKQDFSEFREYSVIDSAQSKREQSRDVENHKMTQIQSVNLLNS